MDGEIVTIRETLAEIKAHQSVMAGTLAEIRSAVMGGDTGHPGLRMEVDRLKRSEAVRGRALWLMVTAGIGVIGERIYDWFSGK